MSRFRLLAVASAKGSPGCSFIAAGLAASLAERGLPTLLVDADAEERGIASLLDLPAVPSGAGRLAGFGPLGPGALAEASLRIAPGLHWLEIGRVPVDSLELATAARGDYRAVVADLGHFPGELQRGLAAAADWVVWVATPDRIGVERADRALGASDFRAAAVGLLLNRCGGHGLADAGLVLAERHRLPVLGRIREAVGAARRLSRTAAPPHRAREFRGAFAELARSLHPDLAAGAGAWS